MNILKLVAAAILSASLTPAAFAASQIDIFACYACQNSGVPSIDAALASNPSVATDGLLFAFVNTGPTSVTNAVFSVSNASPNDQYNIGTIGGNSTVIVMPGLSNDGGAHSGLFTYTGTTVDTSDGQGGVSDTSIFSFTGLLGAQILNSGNITPGNPALIQTWRDPGATGKTSFLGNGPNGDWYCYNCYFGQIGTASIPAASVTPIPAAIWMVGSALVGLIGFGRSKLHV